MDPLIDNTFRTEWQVCHKEFLIYFFLFFCNLCISTRYDSLFQHGMRCTLFTIHFSFNTVSMVFADFLSLNVYLPLSGYFITIICLRYHRFKHCHWYYNKLRLFEQLVPYVFLCPIVSQTSGARFSKVPVTFRARNQIFRSKYKE